VKCFSWREKVYRRGRMSTIGDFLGPSLSGGTWSKKITFWTSVVGRRQLEWSHLRPILLISRDKSNERKYKSTWGNEKCVQRVCLLRKCCYDMLTALRFVHIMYGAREISAAPPCLTRVLRRASGSFAMLFKSCLHDI
jgi:hypothetical protein